MDGTLDEPVYSYDRKARKLTDEGLLAMKHNASKTRYQKTKQKRKMWRKKSKSPNLHGAKTLTN